ncbi:MAG: NAD(P)H-hydrate dehydratase [Deltaproteobacteria bacterium]|nr:NAD(P)H-hydrate dehydratase [Deltaproteobacteria bacterium]
MRLATAEFMRSLDRQAIEEYGIPGIVLMENAARGTVQAMFRHIPDLLREKVGIFAGRGNNGGDAFAVARYLMNRGIACGVYLLGSEKDLKGEAAVNYKILRRMGGKVSEIQTPEDLEAQKGDMARATVIVDGIFGTGLNAPVKGLFLEVIAYINSLNRRVVAIDIPSGLNADSGQVLGICVTASITVTYGLAKRGLVVQPGARYCGQVTVIDISLPATLVDGGNIKDYLLEAADLVPLLAPRSPDAHKGDFGHLLVVAGSPGKSGAAAMVCQAAVRVGTGLVTLAIAESLHPIFAVKLTEAMTELLPETKEHTLGLAALAKMPEITSRKTALAIGPGVSLHAETQKFIQGIVQDVGLPMVIDADGLTALAGKVEILKNRRGNVILTPHPGEMARLLGSTTAQVQQDRIEIARKFSTEQGVVLVLKGASTVIADPDGNIFINPTGNPGMASGGMGDVLTGMIAGFLAQGFAALEAAQLGVFLHGLAGDYVAFRNGGKGLAATDLIQEAPRMLQAITEGRKRIAGFPLPLRQETGY